MRIILLMALWGTLASAADQMAFMGEGDNGKQIYLYDRATQSTKALTEGPLWHIYPDISTDGKSLVYAQGSDGDQLVITWRDLSTGLEKTLSSVSGMNLHPRFSKDGQCVAFSGPNPKGQQVIHLLNLPLQTEIEISYGGGNYFPAPSSHCDFVVFQSNTNDHEKLVVEYQVSTGQYQVLTEKAHVSMSPSLSFDDRLVAFTQKVNEQYDIFTYDRYSQTTTLQIQNPSGDMAPTFTYLGKLAFASNRTGQYSLYQSDLSQTAANQNVVKFEIAQNGQMYSPRFTGDLVYTQGVLPAAMNPPRSSFAVAQKDGKVYMVGGHQGREHTYPASSFLNRLDVYNIATQTWASLPSRNYKAHGYDVAICGNFIYAFGGFAFADTNKPQWKSLDVIERYDIENKRWKVIGKLPRPRSSYVLAQIDNMIYLIGGWDSTPKSPDDYEGTFQSKIDIFDCQKETSQEATFELPQPLRRAFTGVVTPEKKILLIGGLGVGSSHFSLLNNVTEVDPTTGQSRELAPLPFATFAPAAGMVGNQLFVFGGMFKFSEQDFNYVNHIYKMDIKENQWTHTGRYLTEAKGFARVFNIDDQTLGVLGGHVYLQNEDHPTSTFEFFKAP